MGDYDIHEGLRSAAWAETYRKFYDLDQPSSPEEHAPLEPLVVKRTDSFPYRSTDTLNDLSPVAMQASDQLVSCSKMPIDQSRYTATSFVVTIHPAGCFAADLNFRGCFQELVPAKQTEDKKVEELKLDIARWEATKKRIKAETGQISGFLISMIQSLAGAALTNVAYLFRSESFARQLSLLPGQIKLIAGKLGKLAQQTKSWIGQTMDSLSQGLSTVTGWATGALNWCQAQFQRASHWFATGN